MRRLPTGNGTLAEFQKDLSDIAAGAGPLPAQVLKSLAKRGYGRQSPEVKQAEAQLADYFLQRYGRAMMETVLAMRQAAGTALADRLKTK